MNTTATTQEQRYTKLEAVRVAFVSAHKASRVGQSNEFRFSLVAIIEPGSENDKRIMQAIGTAAKKKWEAGAAGVLKALAAKDNICYKRRDFANGKGEVYEGFAGMYALPLSNESAPKLRDRDGSPLTPDSGRPFSGCYCNVWADIWAQDNGFGQRVNGTLGAIQYVSDGPAFGKGGPVSDDVFEDLTIGEEATAPTPGGAPDAAAPGDDLASFL
ncbi:MAG: ssDNA-binding protein [Polynucleobacter sp.]